MMGLFTKTITLAVAVFIFEDDQHPALVSPESQNVFVAQIVLGEIIKMHYWDDLKNKKWNYHFIVSGASSEEFNAQCGREDFRISGAHVDMRKFYEFCDTIRVGIWQDYLVKESPKYDRHKLLAAMETVNYDWFAEHNAVVLSVILQGYAKGGTERFKNTDIRY